MKAITKIALFALLGLTLNSQSPTQVLAYDYKDDDEYFTDPDEGDQEEQGEEKTYDSKEKEHFIYGVPGSEEYKREKSPEEIMRLDLMWELDLDVQQVRGVVQGFKRGFYKDYDWELPALCFGKQAVMQLYWIKQLASSLNLDNFFKINGLIYNLYYNFDHDCQIEEQLFDLSNFCFHFNCNPQQLLQNNMGAVFQVTGALNALAAIYYEEEPQKDLHMAWFDRFSDIGKNIGKLARYTLKFDPDALAPWQEGYIAPEKK
mmetsp:Transcript_14227/g.24201  ORF Transcript_14227/g.24201 Transcript_14227/m.24201 type:complete len:260 (-) Transcript_14227:102-881(-)